jgi:hypothetical protein
MSATARHTLVAINKVATNGDRFPCAPWTHMRRIRWTGETPPDDVQDIRNGRGCDWGGAILRSENIAVIFDGPGNGPNDSDAWAIAEKLFDEQE